MASHLLANTKQKPILEAALRRAGIKTPWFSRHNSALAAAIIDVVTLGAPPRYLYAKKLPGKLLHIINHRSPYHLAGNFRGIWQTKDGDYIQQIGVAGSDFISASQKIQKINKQLDLILGEGSNNKVLLQTLKLKRRLVPGGHNLLIDFGDSSHLMPNAQKTLFGHGVYTQKRHMQLIFSLICRYY